MKKIITIFIFCSFLTASNIALAQRTHQSIDKGWRFLRGDAPQAVLARYDDRSWQRVDLPNDYSIEDLPPAANDAAVKLDAQGWRLHTGDNADWSRPVIEEGDWKSVPPRELNSLPPNSYAWFRRRFTIPASLHGKNIQLVLGKIDDADVTYVNGVQVGATGTFPPAYATAWTQFRRYPVPASLLKGDGTDTVAVRVYNGNGAGGLMPPSALYNVISGPFDSSAVGGPAEAFTVGGPGWYRKFLQIPKAWKGRQVSVEFDGAYHDATVWLNNKKISTHPYGYTSFAVDITTEVLFGGSNLLAVRLDTSGSHSRWYSGSGLYRHVWLTTTPSLRFKHWRIFVSTPRIDSGSADVNVRAEILNSVPLASVRPVLRLAVLDPSGRTVATGQTVLSGDSKEQAKTISLKVPKPALWSPENPALYTLRSQVLVQNQIKDDVRTPFGIRTVSFDAMRGCLLNGKPIKLRGGCVHHDNGPLGSAAYDRAEERRVEILKAAGFNALRMSHNPPSQAFLDACDRKGMLVIDEAFDQWSDAKTPMDYARFFADNWQSDIRSMVERDRNHPSIILWSIGNKIPEQMTQKGAFEAKELGALVHTLDPTRLITAAYSGGYGPGRDEYMQTLDVVGYNYKRDDYVQDHAKFPNRVMVATESVPKEAFDYWKQVEQHPYVIGDFVWTAMDYLGEAGIGRAVYPGTTDAFSGDFPWTVSNCGDIDLIGQRRPQSYYRGIVWNIGPKVVAFVDAVPEGDPGYTVTYWGWPDETASWTWPGSEGKYRTVRVYARTPKVRLLLNGKSLGDKETSQETHYTASYSVPYEAGTLEAIGLTEDGAEAAHWTLKTTGIPVRLRLISDRPSIRADGEDLSYVSVELLDQDGNVCVNASNKVTFTLKGPGKLLAVGSGKPTNSESFTKPVHSMYQGRLLAIVEAGRVPGHLVLAAAASDIKAATTVIKMR